MRRRRRNRSGGRRRKRKRSGGRRRSYSEENFSSSSSSSSSETLRERERARNQEIVARCNSKSRQEWQCCLEIEEDRMRRRVKNKGQQNIGRKRRRRAK